MERKKFSIFIGFYNGKEISPGKDFTDENDILVEKLIMVLASRQLKFFFCCDLFWSIRRFFILTNGSNC